jgi:hypothetical protein
MFKAAGAGAILAALPSVAGAQSAGTSTTGGTGTGPLPAAPLTGRAPYQEFPFYPQVSGTYTPERLQDIMNVAQTAEHLATTLVNAAIQNASKIGLTGLVLQVIQAALAEEVYHVQFLASMGATPLTDTFTVPDPKILTDFTTFFRNLEVLETICNAAYLTATREFAELGQPLLAKFAYQAGSVEAEHRVLARAALALQGNSLYVPPNNKAFETDYFLYMRDVVAALTGLGFIGGSGTSVAFPGTTSALANAGAVASLVVQKLPNNAPVSSTAANTLTGERGNTP